MAFTFTLIKQNVMGNQRVAMYKVVTETTYSGAVATPMGKVDAAILSPLSAAAFVGAVKINTAAASAAANGSVFISSTTNGDEYYLTVYGH